MRAMKTLCLLLIAAGCSTTPAETVNAHAIRWGSSFGMCVGYCTQVLEATPERLRLTRSSRDPGDYPTRTVERPITAAEWQSLRSALEDAPFLRLEETHGCPDCADGGAEWVEVVEPALEKRVTFEYGESPREIADLVASLRALRQTFPRDD